MPLQVLIVGAGIGGLLASIGLALDGHSVVVVDQAATFGEVGAGMRIPPNSFKLLHRWGVDLTYMKKTHSNGNRFLCYDSGEILAHMPHGIPEWDFGGSYLMVHRADYHDVLLAKARSLGVDVRPDHRVVDYDWDAPKVVFSDGTSLAADLLVVADGVQSSARAAFQGHALPPTDTGDLSYRVLVPGQVILADPTLADLVSQPWVSSWCGPGAHVIGYPVRGGEIYNVVFCVAANTMEDVLGPEESKRVLASNKDLVRRFQGWDPIVQKLAALAGQNTATSTVSDRHGLLQWRLFDLAMVDRWVHPSGKAVLLGDAAHPMLPYMASGAAMASEDAAVLRTLLKTVKDKEDILPALQKYEQLRRPRASKVQQWGRHLQHAYHLADGEEQKQRDVNIKLDIEANPIYWGYKERRDWLFGFDAEDIESK